MRKSTCLLPLALGTFGLGLTEFVMMGILPDTALAMKVSIPQAGSFISMYALGVVAGAVLLVVIARTKPLKTILLWLMSIFTIANLATAFVGNYHLFWCNKIYCRASSWSIFRCWCDIRRTAL